MRCPVSLLPAYASLKAYHGLPSCLPYHTAQCYCHEHCKAALVHLAFRNYLAWTTPCKGARELGVNLTATLQMAQLI